jgi:lysophospholipase L1-like esterase
LVEAWAKDRPGVKYVETWDLVMRPDGTAREDLFLPDKLHFNAEGYRLLADRVRPVLPKAE